MPVEMNLTSVFSKVGSFIPGLTPPVTSEIQWVDAPPYTPMKRPAGGFDLSAMIPGFPKIDMKTAPGKIDDLLALFLPGLLPKDFKFAKVFVPGGIVISEMEELMHALAKKRGAKGAGMLGLGRADNFAAGRTALRLVTEGDN